MDKRSYWKLIEGFKAHLPLPFTTTELMPLHMSRDILRIFDGTVFQESIESLFERVKKYIPFGFADSDLFEELSVCFAPPLKKDGYKIHQLVNRFLKGAQQNWFCCSTTLLNAKVVDLTNEVSPFALGRRVR